MARRLVAPGLAIGLGLLAATHAFAAAAPTFDEVMAAPDDADLNLRYAYAQADAGALLEAAAALERVLLVHPDWHAVRLYYAVVLYRLEDIQASRRQLGLVDTAGLSALQRKQAESYRALTGSRQRQTDFRGMLAVGGAYDGDALGALLTQLDAPGGSLHESGSSATVQGRAELGIRLDQDGRRSAYVSAAGYSKSDLSGPNQDFQQAEVQAGFAGKGLMQSWRFGGVVRHSRLFGEPYVTEYGGRALAVGRITAATSVTIVAEAVRQDFNDAGLRAIPTLRGAGRDGWRSDISAGISHRISGRSSIGLTAAYENKSAGYRPFAYGGPRIEATFNSALGRGAYLSAYGSVRFLDFKAADPVFLRGARREDATSYGRLAVGAPLSAFTKEGATADVRERIVLEGSLSYTRRDSKSPIVDFDSVGGEVRLIWRFGDGG